MKNELFQIEGKTLLRYLGTEWEEEITIPEGIEVIEEKAFSKAGIIERLILPSTLKHIKRFAFNTPTIFEITIQDGLVSIGDYAFQDTSVKEIYLPASVVRIGKGVFSNSDLKKIQISHQNPCYELRGDTLFDVVEKKIIAGFGTFEIKGNDIEQIADEAFFGTALERISLPNGIKTIGVDCFSDCELLESIHLPESVLHIESGAFSGCYSLESIILPNGLTAIGDLLFSGCNNLKSISIPDSVEKIGKYAFSNCNSLCKVFIPKSVHTIGKSAFAGNENLKTIDCEVIRKPSYWDDEWNCNDFNTCVCWGIAQNEDVSNLVLGKGKGYESKDVYVTLVDATFDCLMETASLKILVQNKQEKDVRVWIKDIGIWSPGPKYERSEGHKFAGEVSRFSERELIFEVQEDWFKSIKLAPYSFKNDYYEPRDCCCVLGFVITYDFGTDEDIGASGWIVKAEEIDIDNEWAYDVKEWEEQDIEFTSRDILYIYKGNIRCHRYSHDIIQATAVLHTRTDDEIELNVEYCTECKKFLLEYTVFEEYRSRYGVLIGNFRMMVNGEFDGEYDLAEESPLKLSGYTVNQRDGYTSRERHYTLARIIHDGIMEKGDVIRYLSYFIRKNGAKRGNETALEKWREDLRFVQQYDIETQPKTIITDIRRY